jgi:hypothetical protein
MPRLRDVLPADVPEPALAGSEAWRLRDETVVAVKLATGAPCDGHPGPFAPWPGPERHVRTWYILRNHKAVGVNEDPAAGVSFPVVDLEGK